MVLQNGLDHKNSRIPMRVSGCPMVIVYFLYPSLSPFIPGQLVGWNGYSRLGFGFGANPRRNQTAEPAGDERGWTGMGKG